MYNIYKKQQNVIIKYTTCCIQIKGQSLSGRGAVWELAWHLAIVRI